MRCLNSICGRDGLPPSTTVCPHCGAPQEPFTRDLLAPGTLLHAGKYHIDFPLGRGGFGVTYRGTHLSLEQAVAIKEYFPRDLAFRDSASPTILSPPLQRDDFDRWRSRFLREGRILARLDHRHVVRVQDLFEENGTAYLVMELVPGQPLRREMEAAAGRQVPAGRVEEIAEALVSALSAVHEEGVYHLDISPENVLTRPDGQITLVDFGAAREATALRRSTRAFRLEYAPSELIGGGGVGPETDLFELGAVLYEMIVGRRAPGSLERLDGKWAPGGMPEPWQSLLTAALRLVRTERPGSVKEWWDNRPSPGGSEQIVHARAEPSLMAAQPGRAPNPPAAQPGSIPKPPIIRVNPIDGAQMIFIPPGEFKRGDVDVSDAPEHQVTLDGYWMYKTPVTVAQYGAFCEATGRKMPDPPTWGWKDDHPVVNVTCDDSTAYCDWARASLPTEAEWEKAARGTDGRAYPWGNAFDTSRLWCSEAVSGDAKTTAPVGSFPHGASPCGCLDMAGNAWQRCADWYDKDYYRVAPARNPTGPGFGQYRVVRGGSWYYHNEYIFRCGYRLILEPANWISYISFRCCVRAVSS